MFSKLLHSVFYLCFIQHPNFIGIGLYATQLIISLTVFQLQFKTHTQLHSSVTIITVQESTDVMEFVTISEGTAYLYVKKKKPINK